MDFPVTIEIGLFQEVKIDKEKIQIINKKHNNISKVIYDLDFSQLEYIKIKEAKPYFFLNLFNQILSEFSSTFFMGCRKLVFKVKNKPPVQLSLMDIKGKNFSDFKKYLHQALNY